MAGSVDFSSSAPSPKPSGKVGGGKVSFGGGVDFGSSGGDSDSAELRLGKALEKADEKGIGDWAGKVAGNGLSAGSKVLGGVMDLLDTTKSAVVATAIELGDAGRALSGKDPYGSTDQVVDTGFSLKDWVKNVRNNVGVGDVIESDSQGKKLPIWAKRGIGLAGDLSVDPLTYLTFGASTGATAATQASEQGVNAGRMILSKDDLALRIFNLTDEALANAGTTREVAEKAANEIAGKGAGRLGKTEYEAVRSALGPEVKVGAHFDFGRLGQATFSPKSAAAVSQAVDVAKSPFRGAVTWYTRHGGRRAGLDDLISRWEEIPGLRALRRDNPLAAARMKRAIVNHNGNVADFGAHWSRAYEAMAEKLKGTIDPHDLLNALENPEQWDELPEAAKAIRGYLDQIITEAEEYTGKRIPRLQNYVPHMATLDMLRMSGGNEAFADLLKKRGLDAEALGALVDYDDAGRAFVKETGLNAKSIEAIHAAAKEAFGEDYVKIFEDNPWEILPKYIQSVQRFMAREGIYGQLERDGLASTMPKMAQLEEWLGKTTSNRKAAQRASKRAAEKASKALEERGGYLAQEDASKAVLGGLRGDLDDTLRELDVVTRRMVRQGATEEEAQAAAIRALVTSRPEVAARSAKAFDAKIAGLEAQIAELAPEREALQRAVDTSDDLTRQVSEALGVHTDTETRLYDISDRMDQAEDHVAQLRLLKERLGQETQDVVAESEQAVHTALGRYMDERLKSIRGMVEGGSGNNHERNLRALKKAVRNATRAGAEPQAILKSAAEEVDAGVDEWMMDLLKGASARGDEQASEALGLLSNEEEILRRDILHVADGAGQWVPPTEHDKLVSDLAKALGAAEDPAEQATIRGQLLTAQRQQRFGQISETMKILESSGEHGDLVDNIAEVIQRALDAEGKDGGLSAQRRVMREFFGENEEGEATGLLADAMDEARKVSIQPKPESLPIPEDALTPGGVSGMADDLIQQFEDMLLRDADAKAAALEATAKSGMDYTRAQAKAEMYDALHGAAARTQLGEVEGKVAKSEKALDKWIEKRAQAQALSDDVSSGWPSVGLDPQQIKDETGALLRMDKTTPEHRALLKRITELEVALAEEGDPVVKELIKQEQAADLARVKSEKLLGKASAWEKESVEHWDTAKEIGLNERQLADWLNTWKHQMKEFVGREGLWDDQDVVEMMAAGSRIAEPKRAWGLLRLHDEVLARWKAYALLSPGYHSRNFFSGVWMNGLAGMSNDPAAYFQFARHWRRYLKEGREAALEGIKDPKYREIFAEVIDREGRLFGNSTVNGYSDVVEHASKRGVLGGEARAFREDTPLRRKLDPTALDNTLLNKNFDAASKVESWLRGPLYIDGRLKGLTPEEAYGQVVKYHFDYDSLGANERKYMKRIVPFYTWTRKNLPVQLEMIAKKPGYYAAYAKAQDNLEIGTPKDAIVPAYFGPFAIRSPWTADQVPRGGEAGARIYWLPDLPFTSLDDLFDGGKLRGQLTPILKVPWELDRGAQFFSGAPFTGKYTKAPTTWAPLLPVLEAFHGRFNLPRVKKVDGDYYLTDRDAYKIEQALPLLGRSRRLAPLGEEKYQDRMFSSWLSIIGGLSSQTNSSQAQESEILRRVRIIESKLKDMRQLDKALGIEDESGGGKQLSL